MSFFYARIFEITYLRNLNSITDAKIFRPSKYDAANAEALRLVNTMPKFLVKFFTPKRASLHYNLPITFIEPGKIYIRGYESSGDESSFIGCSV